MHGEEEITTLHPKLEPILRETYGICVYQEQIMEIADQLFGYELGEADLMRKAVSKKLPEELEKHRAIFMERGPPERRGCRNSRRHLRHDRVLRQLLASTKPMPPITPSLPCRPPISNATTPKNT